MTRTGLLFGSFDPVHTGHLIIADYLLAEKYVDTVWFVISPQNPLKKHLKQSSEKHRLAMLRASINNNPAFTLCDVELDMPRPNYTWKTLQLLKNRHPDNVFSLIVGTDNLLIFDQWKDYDKILESTPLLVYPRPGYDSGRFSEHENVIKVEAPVLEISSTYIRKSIAGGYYPRYMLADATLNYIRESGLYTKNM